MSHDHSGLCSHCNSPNLYTDFDCRVCGQRLPWADAMTQKLFEGRSVALGMVPSSSNVVPSSQSYAPTSISNTPPALLAKAPRHTCPNCGEAYPADASYCPSCGIRIWEGMTFNQFALQSHNKAQGSQQLATQEKGDFTRTFFVAVFLIFAGWMMLTGSLALLPLVVIVLCFAVLCRLLR